MTAHRVADVSFRLGIVDCYCGVQVTEPDDPAGDRNAGLESAWREHRRAVGAPARSVSNTIGKRLGGDPQRFSLHLKALR